MRPSGLASITMTNPDYRVYHGVDLTLNKRYSNRWQAQVGVTLQTNPSYFPEGSGTFIDPQGRDWRDGRSTISRYVVKANGSYSFPWDIMASANLNITEGAARTVTINGPGAIYGGVNANGAATTINRNTVELEPRGTTRLEPVKLLDLGVQKAIKFDAVPGAADVRRVQRLQHQHHHRLLERQPQPGRITRSRPRSSRRACSGSGRGSCSRPAERRQPPPTVANRRQGVQEKTRFLLTSWPPVFIWSCLSRALKRRARARKDGSICSAFMNSARAPPTSPFIARTRPRMSWAAGVGGCRR